MTKANQPNRIKYKKLQQNKNICSGIQLKWFLCIKIKIMLMSISCISGIFWSPAVILIHYIIKYSHLVALLTIAYLDDKMFQVIILE